jgi:hypothetical protein
MRRRILREDEDMPDLIDNQEMLAIAAVHEPVRMIETERE